MKNERNISAMGKQLYALSSFLSESLIATKLFIEQYDGLTLLHRFIDLQEKATEEYVPIKVCSLYV